MPRSRAGTRVLASRAGTQEDEEPSEAVGELTHTGSIYTYMLLMPPLAQKVRGHYCTHEVIMGFALLALAFTLQVSLTLIGGRKILAMQADYHGRLVNDHAFSQNNSQYGLAMEDNIGDTFGMINDEDTSARYSLRGKVQDSSTSKLEPDQGESQNQRQKRSAGRARNQQLEASVVGAHNCSGMEPDSTGPEIGSLCSKREDGYLDCAPRTLSLLEKWEQLDVNGDGRWAIGEAKDDVYKLGCYLGVPLEDVFRAACRGMIADAQDADESGMRSPELPNAVLKRRSIPHRYFKWWHDLIGICVYTDAGACSKMMSQGHFDDFHADLRGPLRDMHLDMAISYCNHLLKPGGICDSALPGTYVMYRARHVEMCGPSSAVPTERFQNPYSGNDHDAIQISALSYSSLDAWQSTNTTSFMSFMFLVLVLWYVNMVDELKDLQHLFDFLLNFPVENSATNLLGPAMSMGLVRFGTFANHRLGLRSERVGRDLASLSQRSITARELSSKTLDDQDFDMIEIDSIDRPHQFLCIFMLVTRASLLIYIGVAGTVFVMSNRTYMDLLLNSLAIAFIFELDEAIFNILVPNETKSILSRLKPLKFKSSFPKTGWRSALFSKFVWGLTIVPLLSCFQVFFHYRHTVQPVMEALDCACLKIGEACIDRSIATAASDAYWDHLAALHR
jgi:hypothetical protein